MSQDGRPDLIYEKFPDKHYAVFTFNRPERLNAMGGDIPRLQREAIQDFAQGRPQGLRREARPRLEGYLILT